MNFYDKYLKKLALFTVSAGLLGLAGCGGGEEEDDSATGDGSSAGYALLCMMVVLVSGDDECVTSAVSGGGASSGYSGGGTTGSGSTGGSTGSGGSTPPATSGNRIYMLANDELEPNDELINANVPRFATRTDPNDQTGWFVNGAANDIDDLRDAFALTPRRAYRYRISLCPPGEQSCQDSVGMDPLTLFWRLLDQDGNEIASSQGAISNKAFVNLDAGLIYYVVVDAGDAMGATVGYRLFVYELG